jgi:hypothetical protein
MPQPFKASEFLASPHRRKTNRAPWAAPVGRRDRQSVPIPTSGHPALGATDTLEHRAEPAEVAQARLFEGILQAEFAELHHLAYRMTGLLHRQPDLNGHELARYRLRIHARIDEIQRLLQALRGRFPHSGETPDYRRSEFGEPDGSPDTIRTACR